MLYNAEICVSVLESVKDPAYLLKPVLINSCEYDAFAT